MHLDRRAVPHLSIHMPVNWRSVFKTEMHNGQKTIINGVKAVVSVLVEDIAAAHLHRIHQAVVPTVTVLGTVTGPIWVHCHHLHLVSLIPRQVSEVLV